VQSGMRLLRKLNRRALELQSSDKEKTEENNLRMRFGIYFFNEAEQSKEGDSDD